jgi:hypothetical protein
MNTLLSGEKETRRLLKIHGKMIDRFIIVLMNQRTKSSRLAENLFERKYLIQRGRVAKR